MLLAHSCESHAPFASKKNSPKGCTTRSVSLHNSSYHTAAALAIAAGEGTAEERLGAVTQVVASLHIAQTLLLTDLLAAPSDIIPISLRLEAESSIGAPNARAGAIRADVARLKKRLETERSQARKESFASTISKVAQVAAANEFTKQKKKKRTTPKPPANTQ